MKAIGIESAGQRSATAAKNSEDVSGQHSVSDAQMKLITATAV